MLPFIAGARRVYGVTNEREHATWHLRRIAELGTGAVPHDVEVPVRAYVNHNRWVIDCECGAGNLADPDLQTAHCAACGAIHRTVVFPSARDLKEIEAELVARPMPHTRNWKPGESVDMLVAENVAHGVGSAKGGK